MKLYSNEIVFRGHPDKVCDQISDKLLDEFISQDPMTRAGIECVGGKRIVFITGEVTSSAVVDVDKIVKNLLVELGYGSDYTVINNLGIQSPDISMGVDTGGAGDQGMMFGYACRDTDEMLPLAQVILQEFSREYYKLFNSYCGVFNSDGKAQITGIYDSNFKLKRIKTFLVSYCNTEAVRELSDSIIKDLINKICSKYNIEVDNILINPTGAFSVGGFIADSGLTGRKIVVDNYHSFAPVGGGAFSGKDPTKVDRSAAYKARQIAKRVLIKNPHVNTCEVQLSYAIGVVKPVSIFIMTDKGIIDPPKELYNECTPENIIKEFNLRSPIYFKTSQYGHFGNKEFPWERVN